MKKTFGMVLLVFGILAFGSPKVLPQDETGTEQMTMGQLKCIYNPRLCK